MIENSSHIITTWREKVRVIYADTDAMGIVYHTNYVRWFEIGRTEMLRAIGIMYAEWESDDFNLPISEAYCHYLYPARFDDILVIETSINYVRGASMRFDCIIWDEKLERKHAEGYTIHACTTKKGKIVRFPVEFVTKLKLSQNRKTLPRRNSS